jgi:hypothetical protein
LNILHNRNQSANLSNMSQNTFNGKISAPSTLTNGAGTTQANLTENVDCFGLGDLTQFEKNEMKANLKSFLQILCLQKRNELEIRHREALNC